MVPDRGLLTGLLPAGCWLLAAGCWLLAVFFCFCFCFF
jgi:hypothetical protein